MRSKKASGGAILEVYCLESVVCVHHVYKQIWTPVVGEKLAIDHCVLTISDACFANFQHARCCLVHL